MGVNVEIPSIAPPRGWHGVTVESYDMRGAMLYAVTAALGDKPTRRTWHADRRQAFAHAVQLADDHRANLLDLTKADDL